MCVLGLQPTNTTVPKYFRIAQPIVPGLMCSCPVSQRRIGERRRVTHLGQTRCIRHIPNDLKQHGDAVKREDDRGEPLGGWGRGESYGGGVAVL